MGANVLDTTEANALVSANPNVHVARLPARGLKMDVDAVRFRLLRRCNRRASTPGDLPLRGPIRIALVGLSR